MQPSQPGPLPDDPRGPIRPWSSLFYRDFAMLWTGGFFSASATQMRYMASFFQVYEISGSALQLGITGVFQAVPFVLFGLFGGVAADAFDRKKMLIITQILNIFPSLAIGLLTLTGGIQVWHIYALITVSSFVGIFGRPARTAYIPRLVPRSRLMNAVTLNTVTDQSTFLIGPVMAGLLIEVLGMGNAYLFNAALFVPAVVTAVAIRTSGKIEGGGRKVSLKSMFEALEFVWVQRIVLSLLLLDLGATVVGFYRPLLPVLAKDVFRVSASGFGILAGAPAIGSVLGSATLLLVGDVRRKGVLVVVAAFLFGASLSLLGVSQWFWMGLFAVGILGYTDAISVTVRRTTIQLLAPDNIRGRAASMMTVFAQAANSSGAFVAGAAATWVGAPNALLVGSVLCILMVAAISLAMPSLWRYRSD